jgi:hypothetical protein
MDVTGKLYVPPVLSFGTEPSVPFEHEHGMDHTARTDVTKKKENFASAGNLSQDNSIYSPVAMLTVLSSSPLPKQRLRQNMSWSKNHCN